MVNNKALKTTKLPMRKRNQKISGTSPSAKPSTELVKLPANFQPLPDEEKKMMKKAIGKQ